MDDVRSSIDALIATSEAIHDVECVNLNPATNSMSPRAVAAMHALNPRPSLGYPGDKYEMGLEGIEQIEVIAAELAATVFGAEYAEVRVPSGALANMYAFMACAQPGDSIIAPPASIGGHVTHHTPGVAGLHGLDIHEAPIDADNYTVDVAGVADLAQRVRPKMITIGCSLNLTHHDVAALRAVADDVDAILLFDAAHLSGAIAGGAWPNPLAQGAHILTMSTYKSLAGPAGGMLLTNDAAIAERVDAIAYPGLTANFDAAKTAGLAVTLADWVSFGSEHSEAMVSCAATLADELAALDLPVVSTTKGFTQSHAFAVDAADYGGGHTAAQHLRRANLLSCAIGIPNGDAMRIGTNELVRWGATNTDMAPLAQLIAQALRSGDPASLAPEVTEYRSQFTDIHFAAP